MKRVLIFLTLLALVGGGYYFFVYKKTPANTSQQTTGDVFPVGGTTDGANAPGIVGTDTAGQNPTNTAPVVPTDAFTQISSGPVAGYVSYKKTVTTTDPATKKKVSTTDSIVRYVSRINGYVYEIKNGGIATQITNIYIPNVYEAVFANNNTVAILRFLREDEKTVATYSVPIPEQNPDGTRTQKDGTYLPDNITNIAPFTTGDTIARFTNEKGYATLTTTTSTNASKKEVFRSTFHDWTLLPTIENSIFVQTKPSALADGFLYRVTKDKRLDRVVGNIAGLTTTISPKESLLLYSKSVSNGFTSTLFNLATNAPTNLGIAVLPEKCTWLSTLDLVCARSRSLPEGLYPDSWYKGLIHFSDDVVRIYTKSNTFDVLTNDKSFDMVFLSVDEVSNTLYFVDKNTGLLWKYQL